MIKGYCDKDLYLVGFDYSKPTPEKLVYTNQSYQTSGEVRPISKKEL